MIVRATMSYAAMAAFGAQTIRHTHCMGFIARNLFTFPAGADARTHGLATGPGRE